MSFSAVKTGLLRLAVSVGRQLSVGSSSVQLMGDRPVSFLPPFAQEPSPLPVRDADLPGRLSLGNQFLLSPLQGIQPISFGLLYQSLSVVHSSGWTRVTGRF